MAKSKIEMMAIRPLLQQIGLLESLCYNRAKDLLEAKGDTWNMTLRGDGIDFNSNPNQVEVKLREVTRHDCPDTFTVMLSVTQLSVPASNWDMQVEKTRKEREQRVKEYNEKQEQQKLDSELKELQRLQEKYKKP